jgi:hypothetical protein
MHIDDATGGTRSTDGRAARALTRARIDPATGETWLTDALAVRASTGPEELRGKAGVRAAHLLSVATSVRGQSARASFHFAGERLDFVTISLAPPASEEHDPAWNGYSLEWEATAKETLDAFLQEQLGTPHKTATRGGFAAKHPVLQRHVRYLYPWGEVSSYHDPRTPATEIAISYKHG